MCEFYVHCSSLLQIVLTHLHRCCSTILPTIISLVGFLLVKFASNRDGNYPSLTLSLDQNNPEITDDRNPIPFNAPGVYDCQPGQCVYGKSTNEITNPATNTSEVYFFCGSNAMINQSTCSIIDSSSIVSEITQYGAFGVENDVSDVLNVS